MRVQTHTDSYIFIDKPLGIVLGIRDLTGTEQAKQFARRLARKHQTIVTVTIVIFHGIEPDRCSECGELLPEVGPCWHNFFEEEAPDSIPFRGEAFPARIITEQDEYF